MSLEDPSERMQIKEKPIEDYFDGIEPTTLRQSRPRKPRGKRTSGKGRSYLIIGSGMMVLMLFFIIIAFKMGKSHGEERITALSEQFLKMEGRIEQAEKNIPDIHRVEDHDKKILLLMDRLGRIEDELSMKMARLDKKLAEIKKISNPPRKPVKKATKKKTTRSAAGSQKFHQVKPGETLYAISKKYGKTVREILKLNPAVSGMNIYPGQKLRIAK